MAQLPRQRITKVITKIALDPRSGEKIPLTEDEERIVIVKGAGLPATFVYPESLRGKRADFIELKKPEELPAKILTDVRSKLDKELNKEMDRMVEAEKKAKEKKEKEVNLK